MTKIYDQFASYNPQKEESYAAKEENLLITQKNIRNKRLIINR